DHAGNVYAVDRLGHRVYRFAPDGSRSVLAGTGTPGHSGDGGPATAAETVAPDGVAVDQAGNVYFTESSVTLPFFQVRGRPPAEDVRMVDASGTIHTVAGSGSFGSGGVGGPALSAQLAAPYSVAVGPDQSLLVGEVGLQRVLRFRSGGALDLVAGRALPVVGAYSGDGGPARTARLYRPEGLGEAGAGKGFLADP